MGGGWKWPRIVSSDGFWYKRRRTFGFCYQNASQWGEKLLECGHMEDSKFL
jgi:hypothetical protein